MKKVMFLLMALPVFAGMLFSCSEAKVDAKKLDGKWTIVEVKGTVVQKEKMPFIEFNMAENRIHGNAGCNMFNTVIKLDPQNISGFTLAPAIATMMACPDMELEGKIMKTFDEIHGVKAGKAANQMILVDKEGGAVLTLEKTN